METIADGCLRDLRDERLRIAQQQFLKLAAARELILQHLRLHPDDGSGALDDGTVGHRAASHEEGNAHYPVITRQTHLRGRTVFHHVQQRDDGSGGEIDVIQMPPGLIDHFAEINENRLQMWTQAFILLNGKGGEKPVFNFPGHLQVSSYAPA